MTFLRHRGGRRVVLGAGAAVLALVGTAVAIAALATSEHAGPQGDGTAYTSYGWKVTPAGKQVAVGERPYGSAMSPDGKHLLVSNDGVGDQSLQVIDSASPVTRRFPW